MFGRDGLNIIPIIPSTRILSEIKKSHLQRQLNAINVTDFFLIFKSFRKYELSKLQYWYYKTGAAFLCLITNRVPKTGWFKPRCVPWNPGWKRAKKAKQNIMRLRTPKKLDKYHARYRSIQCSHCMCMGMEQWEDI